MKQTVIVAGGLGTLGSAVVTDLHRRGAAVAVVDMAPGVELAGAALVLGGVDLAEERAVAAAYGAAAERLGAIDAVVNVAGGFVWDPVEGGDIDNWDRMYRMNLRTAAASSRAAIPFLRGGTGAIVNVGAAGATRPGTGMAPYAAAKAGVRALTESLAEELRSRKVRVNAVLPTIIDTPANRREMPDADRSNWVRPEAVANVIAFLISDQAAAISGACIPLSLG